MKLGKSYVYGWPPRQRAEVMRKCFDVGWGYDCRGYALRSGWARGEGSALLRRGRRLRGMGDVVHLVVSAIGLARLVKHIWPDCGCERRRRWLNEHWPLRAADNPTADID